MKKIKRDKFMGSRAPPMRYKLYKRMDKAKSQRKCAESVRRFLRIFNKKSLKEPDRKTVENESEGHDKATRKYVATVPAFGAELISIVSTEGTKMAVRRSLPVVGIPFLMTKKERLSPDLRNRARVDLWSEEFLRRPRCDDSLVSIWAMMP